MSLLPSLFLECSHLLLISSGYQHFFNVYMVKTILSTTVVQICVNELQDAVTCSCQKYGQHSESRENMQQTCSQGHAQNIALNCHQVLDKVFATRRATFAILRLCSHKDITWLLPLTASNKTFKYKQFWFPNTLLLSSLSHKVGFL